MTVASALTALSPNLWLKLDETSGTDAANSGSLLTHGTYSGSYQQGVAGPEQGTFATRLFSGGQVVSTAGMDVTGVSNYSIGLFLSTDASGVLNTSYPLIGIGDVSNRMARGPLIYERHSAIGTPQIFATWNAQGGVNVNTPQPLLFWHWFVVTYTTGTNGIKLYMDGTLGTQLTPSGNTAALSTDPLLIRCDEPFAVAHVCFWGTVLSQAQIQSVSSQIAPWPPNQPINTSPTGGGGGGGLTSDQAAQLTDIQTKVSDIPGLTAATTFISDTVNHIKGVTDDTATKVAQILTDTHNIVNTLLPQLADVINDIGAQVTQILGGIMTKITTAGGSVLQTIGDFFSKHSADVFGLSNATGGPTCDRVDLDISNSHFWGVMVHITTRPPMYWAQTPDKDWSYPDLAVITIQRGGFDIYRKAVHGTWETISPLPEALPEGVAGIAVPLLPQNYHILVDWAFGVCGEVILQYIP